MGVLNPLVILYRIIHSLETKDAGNDIISVSACIANHSISGIWMPRHYLGKQSCKSVIRQTE
jgi:hypothetical protein